METGDQCLRLSAAECLCSDLTETLGMAFEPEQKYENPDGTPIVFRYDYFGNRQGIHPLPGPFASKEAAEEALS